ncbi:hypothetical protein ACJX0J_029047, partial [Zea mays]
MFLLCLEVIRIHLFVFICLVWLQNVLMLHLDLICLSHLRVMVCGDLRIYALSLLLILIDVFSHCSGPSLYHALAMENQANYTCKYELVVFILLLELVGFQTLHFFSNEYTAGTFLNGSPVSESIEVYGHKERAWYKLGPEQLNSSKEMKSET